MSAITETLQTEFYRCWSQRYEIIAPNIFCRTHEMDLVAIRRSRYLDEIEIKASKSDFKADFKKTISGGKWPHIYEKSKHEALAAGELPCNYFSFLMPEALAESCEIPDYCGLYIYIEKEKGPIYIREIKKAPLLHKNKTGDTFKADIGEKMIFRYWAMMLKTYNETRKKRLDGSFNLG